MTQGVALGWYAMPRWGIERRFVEASHAAIAYIGLPQRGMARRFVETLSVPDDIAVTDSHECPAA